MTNATDKAGELVSPAAELSDAIERANARLIAHPEPVAELSDEHLELIQRIEKRLGWIESGLEINEIDFAKDIRSLLARSPAQPASGEVRKIRAAFHVNMMRAYPGKTHDEISAEIDRALATPAAQEGDKT